MIYEIKTVDGVKTKVPLTGNGYGLPLGTWISYEGTCPDGFIESEQTFNTTTYAALYALLGTNKVPTKWEYSEPILLENEKQNGSSPCIIPANFGVIGISNQNTFYGNRHIDYCEITKEMFLSKGFVIQNASGYSTLLEIPTENPDGTFSSVFTASQSVGNIYYRTRKHLAIKATPAYVEPDTVSDMVNTLRTQDSYSTSEVNTGKKWIDGKPIYSIVFITTSTLSAESWGYAGIRTAFEALNIDSAIFGESVDAASNVCRELRVSKIDGLWSDITLGTGSKLIIEYTKTTD